MSERNMSDFEKEVRKTLIDKGMSMSDLASELGVSASYGEEGEEGNFFPDLLCSIFNHCPCGLHSDIFGDTTEDRTGSTYIDNLFLWCVWR